MSVIENKMPNDKPFDLKVLCFLLDANKLFTGIHIQEISNYNEPYFVKFESNTTNLFISSNWWTPTPLFFEKLFELIDKHFGIDDHNKVYFNNTQTTFWFRKDIE